MISFQKSHALNKFKKKIFLKVNLLQILSALFFFPVIFFQNKNFLNYFLGLHSLRKTS